MKTTQRILPFFSILTIICVTCLLAEDKPAVSKSEKFKEAELALHSFKIPNGMTGDVFAAEPLLANPVAFCFDEQGRVYVAETYRRRHGVEDNRGHANWLLDDLAAQSVADRIAYIKKWMKDDAGKFAIEQERVRQIVDQDGDGIADHSTFFAEGFNQIEDGIGAGVLAYNGSVYYTCIPKLWLLKDTNNDGQADVKKPLYDGFGVRFAFTGHDLHGLILGPDGRLYFSIGDRGFNVDIDQKHKLAIPDQGAVFRCELDGSNLEVFCQGLRNPQELAFDHLGNLFTGDNNSDGGDKARWVYLPEGSDSGWRMYYQYHPDRGPWNREKLWHLKHPGQAAYIVPPVAHIASGPSGLTYYPGTGLDDKYQGHFFLVDFRGQASNSGVRNFSLTPQGASYDLVNAEEFVWSVLATDVEFGFDGAIYLTDWVDGWDSKGQGRIFRFRDNRHGQSDAVKQVQSLIKSGFDSRSIPDLVTLLDHADYRIRLRAQMALANKNAIKELTEVALKAKSLHPRIHALWGIWQLARRKPDQLNSLLPLFDDPDPEIRAQMARVSGDVRYQKSTESLKKLLKEHNSRLRLLAAIALGRIKDPSAVIPLMEALAENADTDPTLRHGLVMGLVGTATAEMLVATHRMTDSPVKRGAIVALRRLQHPGLAEFLKDADPSLVAEAVSAIHDLRIEPSLPAVAKLVWQPSLSEPVMRRVMSANFMLGQLENAEGVAAFAANPVADETMRLEALHELTDWNNPDPLDRVTNEFRKLPSRSVDIAKVIRPWIDSLLNGSPKIREAAILLATRHKIEEVEPYLIELIKDQKQTSSEMRLAALVGLNSMQSPRFKAALEVALSDPEAVVRSEAQKRLVPLDAARAIQLLEVATESTSIPEQQSALLTLAEMKNADADAVLEGRLQRLLDGKITPAIQLDLLNAAKLRRTKLMQDKLKAYEATKPANDLLKNYRETLAGGNAQRGRQIFFDKSELSCRRCHKVQGQGGDVGPDLSRIGADKTREYLLESIVDPNKQIAKGFETVILETVDGKVYAGISKHEDEQSIQLIQPDGRLISIAKSDIEDRTTGKSGMPDDLSKKVSLFELRDLVEYLSSLKTAGSSLSHGEEKKK